MFNKSQTYEQLAMDDSHNESTNWRQDPDQSVESRNKQISIHRRPGFYKKGLLGSILINAILLMLCAWMYMKLELWVAHAYSCHGEVGLMTTTAASTISSRLIVA